VEHIKSKYQDDEYNVVLQHQYKIDKRKLMNVGDIDADSKLNYCTGVFLYPKGSSGWKFTSSHSKKTAPFFPFDIDCGGDSVKAQLKAREIVEELFEKWGIDKYTLWLWFSGNGFHIEIPEEWFGCFEPDKDLHLTFKKIHNAFNFDTDPCLTTPFQMYRCPNAINDKNNLYKIQIDIDELYGDIEVIKEKAKKPQEIREIDTNFIEGSDAIYSLMQDITSPDDKTVVNTPKNGSNKASNNRKRIAELENGVSKGERNKAHYELALKYKDVEGLTKEPIRQKVMVANENFHPPETKIHRIEATLESAWNQERKELPPNAYWKFEVFDAFIISLEPREEWFYTCLLKMTSFWDRDFKGFTIHTNQVRYTHGRMMKRGGFTKSECETLLPKLRDSEFAPYTYYVEFYPNTKSPAFTRLTHHRFNHNYFREKEKNEYKEK